jgi:hypothetical protein
MNKLQKIKSQNKKIIGIWGYPEPKTFLQIREKFPQHEIIDLDINYKASPSNIIPDAYCRIIRNIIDNAIDLKDNLEVIIASVGEEKCDSGRFAAKILEDMGFNVIKTKYNENNNNFDTPISKSNLPLKEKILTIMDNIIEKQTSRLMVQRCCPEYGFWGVPPNDLSLLELFPDTTHVYGWTRCVEAERPADIDLEMFVDKNVPTVFFAQTFCAKMQLAKYLAKKNDGLYVDVDDKASNSVRAKIEAFIKLG